MHPLIPPVNAVNPEINIIVGNRLFNDDWGVYRIRRKIPAVTSVDEWTRADTGVGAAMASGNHLLKGLCALFVIAVINTIR